MHTGLRDRSSPAEKTEDRSPERTRRVRRIDSNKLDRSARGLSTHRPSGLCEIALARAHKPRRCYARTFPWRQARSRCPWRRGRLASPRGSRPLSSGASRPTPTVARRGKAPAIPAAAAVARALGRHLLQLPGLLRVPAPRRRALPRLLRRLTRLRTRRQRGRRWVPAPEPVLRRHHAAPEPVVRPPRRRAGTLRESHAGHHG
jgi:hypothetical protein